MNEEFMDLLMRLFLVHVVIAEEEEVRRIYLPRDKCIREMHARRQRLDPERMEYQKKRDFILRFCVLVSKEIMHEP
jgi:hypothetical protein